MNSWIKSQEGNYYNKFFFGTKKLYNNIKTNVCQAELLYHNLIYGVQIFIAIFICVNKCWALIFQAILQAVDVKLYLKWLYRSKE